LLVTVIISFAPFNATLNVLKKFLAEAERLTEKKVLWVRVNRSQEWDNWLWTEFKNQQGFIIEFTTAYAYQQNGATERSMCTILDTARSMLVDSGLPTKYWPEVVQTAVYLRNLVPSKRNPDMVPAEMWYRNKQDMTHLCVFNATVYVHISSDLHLLKLGPRVTRLMLIGYFRAESYKLLDQEMGSVYSGRNVCFEEGTANLTKEP